MTIEPYHVLLQSEQMLVTHSTKEHWKETHFDEPWVLGWEFEPHHFSFHVMGIEVSFWKKHGYRRNS